MAKTDTSLAVGIIGTIIIVVIAVSLINTKSAVFRSGPASISSTGGSYGVGGPGSSYMSSSEAASLVGTCSKYNYTASTNSTYIARLLLLQSQGSPTVFTNNVIGVWIVACTQPQEAANVTVSQQGLVEVVYESPQAHFLYNQTIARSTFNVTNATLNGMTYSYSTSSNATLNATAMIGLKGTEISEVLVLGKQVSQDALASTVAGDMP